MVATGFPEDRQYDIDAVSRARRVQGDGDDHRGVQQELHLLHRPQDPRPRARAGRCAEILREVRAPRRLRLPGDRAAGPDRQPLARAGRGAGLRRPARPGRDRCRACGGCASSPPTRATSRRGWWSRWGSTPTSAPTCTCPCSPAPTACCAAWGAATRAASTSTSSAQLRRARPGPGALDRPHRRLSRARRKRTSSSTLELVRRGPLRRDLRLQVLAAAGHRGAAAGAAPSSRRSPPSGCSASSPLQEGIQEEINESWWGRSSR